MHNKFKDFIKDEGLERNKNKSWIRTGWDGRQDQVDTLKGNIDKMRELSVENFERYEDARATVVKLEELIESNKEMVAKSSLIHEQNEELMEKNTKINNALAKIAKDIANNHIIQQAKDERIQKLEDELARK